jgi:hypothetical protein
MQNEMDKIGSFFKVLHKQAQEKHQKEEEKQKKPQPNN